MLLAFFVWHCDRTQVEHVGAQKHVFQGIIESYGGSGVMPGQWKYIRAGSTERGKDSPLIARGCCLISPHSKASSRSYSSSCPYCMKENGVLSVTEVLHPPCVRPLCYEASALGASFLPFLWEGESEVFTVLRGGLCSATSSCSEGSLYMATEGTRRTKTH